MRRLPEGFVPSKVIIDFENKSIEFIGNGKVDAYQELLHEHEKRDNFVKELNEVKDVQYPPGLLEERVRNLQFDLRLQFECKSANGFELNPYILKPGNASNQIKFVLSFENIKRGDL